MPTVLVIENDVEVRETLSDIVLSEGYVAVGVEAGDQAIEYLQAHDPPCLVLLDLGLPRVSGKS